jgi:hypothetical protein
LATGHDCRVGVSAAADAAARQAFLVVAVEEFSPAEGALILDVETAQLRQMLEEASEQIYGQMATAARLHPCARPWACRRSRRGRNRPHFERVVELGRCRVARKVAFAYCSTSKTRVLSASRSAAVRGPGSLLSPRRGAAPTRIKS